MCSASQLDAEVEARALEMALGSMASSPLTAALWSVTFCLVNPGRRVKVGGFFKLPRVFAGEPKDATNVRSRRAATMKWMGCPVIAEQRMEEADACLHLSLPAFLFLTSAGACRVFGVKKAVLLFWTLAAY